VRKSLIVVFGLVFLIGLILVPALPVKAQANSVISLEEQNVILPNSDIELISAGEDTIYAVVNCQSKYYLFLSENEGRSWQKVSGQGLPEKEKFIALKSLAEQPEIVVLATTTMVYLSSDGGESFGCLGGPQDLTERKEEITSLAISGGNVPKILVGVWHPNPGKFAQEGVYLWGWEGKREWEAQGMKPTWQGKGYQAEVTSVAFHETTILAVATGDPDGSGPLPEGTYLNIGYPNQRSTFGAEWNWPSLSGWPVEVAETQGLSPTEKEILNSRIVFPKDLEIEEPEERNFYILYNTRDKDKDDVYKVEDIEVRRLKIPKYPEIVSLDSLDYVGTYFEGTLAVGVTCKDRDKKDQAQVYYLPSDEERFTPPDWSTKWMKVPETRNCQVAFSPDLAESGIILAATSGKNSSFARSYKDVLVPISLMDIVSGRIDRLSPSPRFLVDRTLFFTYGDKNILKIVLEEDYQLGWVERILLIPEGFNPARIKIEPYSNYLVFVFETGTNRFWLTKNGGLSWSYRERETEIMDLKVIDDKVVYIAGKDSMVYRSENAGTSWPQRISSGIRWLQKIEVAEGKILAVGGSSKENLSDTISLVGEDESLPSLPVSVSYPEGLMVVYSQKDNSVYCGANNQLYRLAMERGDWEKITEFGRRTTELLISPQGLYAFCKPQVYFSSFPLSEDSQWENLEIKGNWLGCKLTEIDEERNLLFLWDSSKIVVYPHQIPEEEPEEEIPPPPVEPQPVEPQPVESPVIEPPPVEPQPVEPPVEPEPVAPEPPTPPAPPVEPPPVSSALPWPIWIVIGLGSAFGIYLLIAYLVTSRRRL